MPSRRLTFPAQKAADWAMLGRNPMLGRPPCSSPSSTCSRSASARRVPTPWGRWWLPRRFLEKAAAASLPRTGPPHRHAPRLARLHRQGPRHRPRRRPGPCGRDAPDAWTPTAWRTCCAAMAEGGSVAIAPDHAVAFNPARDVIFDFGPALKGHANGMVFRILDDDNNTLLAETYFSIGGGFVQTEAERAASVAAGQVREALRRRALSFPHRCRNAGDGPPLGPHDRRDEARERARGAERRRSSTPISTRSGPPCATA